MTAIARTPHSGRLVETACWLLAAVCALLALRLAVTLIDGVDVDFETIPVTEMGASEPVPEGADWRLFGRPGEPDYGFRQPLPATPLALRLRGVVTGDRGYAIIVDAQGDEGVYRVGDEVPGKATVVTIQARRVVLERDGTREALELPGSGGAATASAAPASGPDDAGDGLAAGVGIGSLGSMTSRFGLDPDALARRITIIPVKGGGFRVRAGRDAPLFTQLGLHANDVVLAINGRPVDNEADVRAVFGDYRPGEALAITVRRGDRQLVLTPDLSIPGGAERQ